VLGNVQARFEKNIIAQSLDWAKMSETGGKPRKAIVDSHDGDKPAASGCCRSGQKSVEYYTFSMFGADAERRAEYCYDGSAGARKEHSEG